MKTYLTKNAAQERAYHDQRMTHADFDLAPFTIALGSDTRLCVRLQALPGGRPTPT
jgi:hypothetical protein